MLVSVLLNDKIQLSNITQLTTLPCSFRKKSYLIQFLEALEKCAPYIKVQMKCFFFIAEFERAAKIRKNAICCFLISLLVPEL